MGQPGMAVRVGVDVVAADEIAHARDCFGERYLARVYTRHERASATGAPAVAAERLAARFAAKEAALKVLRPVGANPPWRELEVHRARAGWCRMRLHGAAARLAREQRLGPLEVSLSHERGMAVAVVIAVERGR